MKWCEAEQKMRGVMRLRHMSIHTERSYMGWVRRYMYWIMDTKPAGESRAKMEAYLTHLATREGVAAATQNQAFNALLFLYRDVLKVQINEVNALRARQPLRRRHAPSREDVKALLAHIRDANGYPVRLLVQLLYGCGLRVREPLNLRIKDFRLDTATAIIREAKGGKDRLVKLPEFLLPALATQLKAARAVWEGDQDRGLPVQLPGQYAKKHPRAQFQWGWAWLFPQRVPCVHPREGHEVRYHLHEANIQREVRRVVQSQDLDCMLTPHSLRHGYATHLAERGANLRDLQAALGHKNLETTMTYLTPEIERLTSPLELLSA